MNIFRLFRRKNRKNTKMNESNFDLDAIQSPESTWAEIITILNANMQIFAPDGEKLELYSVNPENNYTVFRRVETNNWFATYPEFNDLSFGFAEG